MRKVTHIIVHIKHRVPLRGNTVYPPVTRWVDSAPPRTFTRNLKSF